MKSQKSTQDQDLYGFTDCANLRFALNEAAILTITDLRGNILFANDKFCQISKYSKEELLGQNHRIVNSQYHPKEYFRDLWRTITRGHVWRGEIRNRSKDGTLFWVDTTIAPILNTRGKPKQYMMICYDITEHKRAQEAIHLIPQQILHGQEEERLRISKEIHDDLGQLLVALKISLVNSAMDLTAQYPALKQIADDLKCKVDDIIEKIRDLSHELSPLSLKHVSLQGAMKELVESMDCDKDISFKFVYRNLKNVDLGTKKIMIYRIVQGALINIVRHAQAKNVEIRMGRKKDRVYLVIKDDGKGFDLTQKRKTGGGFGLTLMKERAKSIGAKLTIKSSPGVGTEIRLLIPTGDEKND